VLGGAQGILYGYLIKEGLTKTAQFVGTRAAAPAAVAMAQVVNVLPLGNALSVLGGTLVAVFHLWRRRVVKLKNHRKDVEELQWALQERRIMKITAETEASELLLKKKVAEGYLLKRNIVRMTEIKKLRTIIENEHRLRGGTTTQINQLLLTEEDWARHKLNKHIQHAKQGDMPLLLSAEEWSRHEMAVIDAEEERSKRLRSELAWVHSLTYQR
jgi:uncharacterized transporter YbjL